MASKKKKWLIGSIVGVTITVLLVVLFANPIMARIAPKQYVLLSLLEMQKNADRGASYTDLIKEKDKLTQLDLKIAEINGLDDPYYKDMIEGLSIALAASSNEAQEILIDTAIKKHGASLVDFSIYSSTDDLGIKIPGLLEQYVTVNLGQFQNQYQQTKLPILLGPVSDEDLAYFEEGVTQTRKVIIGEAVNGYSHLSDDYQKILTTLAKAMDVKFTGADQANTFSIHLANKDLVDFQRDLIRVTFRDDYSPTEIQNLILQSLSESSIEDIEINLSIDNKKQILETELMGSLKSDQMFNFYINTGMDQGLVFQLQEDDLDLLSAHLELKKDLGSKDYNRSFIADISLVQSPSINIKFSGDFSIEKIKDTPMTISDAQKLDLFSLGAGQMLDLIFRLGKHFYQLNQAIGGMVLF